MEMQEIKQLLQHYFNGESTMAEERQLEKYFQSGNVAEELREYTEFFSGISRLSDAERDEALEGEIMDFILKNEPVVKPKSRWLWQTISGIAASIIIVVGGVLFYQQDKESFKDTFDNPEEAYAYAEQTLGYISEQYNRGLAGLEHFEKLQTASEPMQKGLKPVNEYLEKIEKMHE